MKYNKLCEMDISELINSFVGQEDKPKSGGCTVQNPIQPDSNVGEFGNSTDIHIKVSEDGGLEIDSKELAVKLSSDVFEAIKSFLAKGE